MEKRKRTSSEVKNRYNAKVYDRIALSVPKEMAKAFREKCTETGTPMAQVLKKAIEDYLNN